MTTTNILAWTFLVVCCLAIAGIIGYWLRDAWRALDTRLTKRTHSLFAEDPITQAIRHADADQEAARTAALRERAYWYGSAPPPSRAHHHRKAPVVTPVVTTNGGRRIHAGNVIQLRQAGGQDTQAQP
jgi:hypothetical protein